MKKFALALMVLMLALPAVAGVNVFAEVDGTEPNLVYIKYTTDNNTADYLPRAFGVDVSVTGSTISDIQWLSTDYYVAPTGYSYDAGSGTVITYGDPIIAPATDGFIIEAGSLYADGEAKPLIAGTLASFRVADTSIESTVALAENAARGGVVLENPDSATAVTLAGTTVGGGPVCPFANTATCTEWGLVGSPDSWNNPRQCYGDANGAENGDPKLGYFWVQEADLGILLNGWKQTLPGDSQASASQAQYDDATYGDIDTAYPWIAADFNHAKNGDPKLGYFRVQEADLGILLNNWKTDGTALGSTDGPLTDCLTK